MGKATGFMEFTRETPTRRAVAERVDRRHPLVGRHLVVSHEGVQVAGEADQQAGDRAAAQRGRDMAVGLRHHLRHARLQGRSGEHRDAGQDHGAYGAPQQRATPPGP